MKEVAMKIIVPTAGPVPDPRTASYVISIAKRLGAQLLVLCILSKEEAEALGELSLSLFVENGREENLAVNGIVKRGDLIPLIIGVAEENSADLIILGVSRGEIVAEWLNANAMAKTDIPVLLIPKWVRGA